MLSVLIICEKLDDDLLRTTQSIKGLSPEILIDVSRGDEPLGVRKNRLLNESSYDWVLVLDTDERATTKLCEEIKSVINKGSSDIHCYKIPYKNYAFGKLLLHGGERFAKPRLFRKKYGKILPVAIHEEILVVGKIGYMNEYIIHNSYRTLNQVIFKFSKYARQMAEEKYTSGERVTLKKLFMYGPHMFWARAIKDEGWRDGWRGILLAFCFAYMETLMYWILLWFRITKRKAG